MNRKTKVLYVIWSLEKGGAEGVVISLARGLDPAHFEPRVVCLNEEGNRARALTDRGIPVYALHKKAALDIAFLRRLTRLIRDEAPDIVHTHLWGANFWGRIAARRAGVPVIVATEHNVDVWKGWFHRLADNILAKQSQCVIAVSEKVREFYARRGVPAERLRTIYNGIPVERYTCEKEVEKQRLVSEFRSLDGCAVITTIGRLVPAKDHRTFLEALRLVAAEEKNIRAFIIGEGEEKKALEAFAREARLDETVYFTGYRSDIPRFLSASDIFVLSSTREGHPLSVLEAMASGVPVVATDAGGTAEVVVDRVTGSLVKPKDPRALAMAILDLLRNRELAGRMSEEARRTVREKFSLETMIERHERLYTELLTNPKH